MKHSIRRLIAIVCALLSLSFILTSCQVFSGLSGKKDAPVKIIFDCDMGYMNDDALALSMLLKAEERGQVKILGITLEGGNNFIDAPHENKFGVQYGSSKYTEELLEKLNRKDIPYFRGTDYPVGYTKEDIPILEAYYENANEVKANSWFGAIHFYGQIDKDLLRDSDDAANFLVKTVRENPGEVVIFAIGPTMNVARAVKKDPEFAQNVKAIYYMGGAFGEKCMIETDKEGMVEGITGANVTPYSEYNVIYDPTSFKTCITAGFKKQVISPASCNVGIDKAIAENFISKSSKTGVSALWAEHYKKEIQDYPYWDPLAVYAFLRPEAISKSQSGYVTVEDETRLSETFAKTDIISDDAFEKLSAEEQKEYGKAQIVFKMDGFWDYTTDLLCK